MRHFCHKLVPLWTNREAVKQWGHTFRTHVVKEFKSMALNGFLPNEFNHYISSFRQSAAEVTAQILSEWRDFLLTASFKQVPRLKSLSLIGCWTVKLQGPRPSMGARDLDPKLRWKTGGLETLSSDGWARPGFVFLNGDVMSHTKLPSSQPASQLACSSSAQRDLRG